MAPKPRPTLVVVRAGNTGHRPIRPGVKLPPASFTEPDWRETFPAGRPLPEEVRRLRQIASREWRRVVPTLERAGFLAAPDAMLLADYCVCAARVDQCERGLTTGGLVPGEGLAKNGLTTISRSYRQQLRAYIGELGLSPSARTRLTAPGEQDPDDPFD